MSFSIQSVGASQTEDLRHWFGIRELIMGDHKRITDSRCDAKVSYTLRFKELNI